MKKTHGFTKALSMVLILVLSFAVCGASRPFAFAAQADSELFRGVTIEFYTPNPAGDSFDLTARLFQRFLQANLPGSRIQVINREGAGGLLAYNEVYNHNNIAILASQTASVFALEYISKDDAVRYKMKNFKWLSYMDRDLRMMVTGASSGYKTIYDVLDAGKNKKIKAGTYAKGASAWNEAVALDFSLDLNLNLIAGYNSSSLLMALLQNEVDVTCGSPSAYKAPIESGEIIPLMVFTETRSPQFPDLPTVYEILDHLKKTGQDKSMALAMINAVTLPKLIAANPKLTDEQWESLQEAFSKTIADPEFKQQADGIGLTIPVVTGREVADMVDDFITRFEANRDAVTAVFQKYLDTY